MQIFIKDGVTNKTITVDLDMGDTLSVLYKKIREKIPRNNFEIVNGSSYLNEKSDGAKKVVDLGLKNEAFVYLVEVVPGGF